MEKFDLADSVSIKDPIIHPSVFIAKGAQIVGDVQLDEDSSVWYNCVLRGDINKIIVGKRTNIQDGSIVHLENDLPCIIGDDVTIGHNAIIHACTIEDGCLIGMGAIILNGAIIKKGSVVGAGAVVKEHTVVEENTLVVGIPAKPVKSLPIATYEKNRKWAAKYVQLAQVHKRRFSQ